MLHIFPKDHLNKEGTPFWSGPKRAPTAIPFDFNDPLHAHYIAACANLIAYSLGIPPVRDAIAVAQIAAMVTVDDWVPKHIKVELPGEEGKN